MGKKILITGGGTGGHISAAIAIAEKCVELGHEVLYVGTQGGLEEKMIPRTQIPHRFLKVKPLLGKGIGFKLRSLLQLPLALARASIWVWKFRPNAALGVGGYVSGPVIAAVWFHKPFFRMKIAILEQNVVPGFTNRVLGAISSTIFCAFAGTQEYFRFSKCVLVGNPTRKEFFPLPKLLQEVPTVFVFGGSQGARGINRLIIAALPYLPVGQLRWLHQTGEKDFEEVLQAHKERGTQSQVEKFIFDMKSAYEKASFVICRSGASTLGELARVRRAAILIPFPSAAGNHQVLNARYFEANGAALCREEKDLSGEILAALILDLAKGVLKTEEMEKSLASLDCQEATTSIVQNLLNAP